MISGGRICGGSLTTSGSASLATKSELSLSANTIDIHLLDPDVDRILAEYERVSPGVLLDLTGASGGGGRGSESVLMT